VLPRSRGTEEGYQSASGAAPGVHPADGSAEIRRRRGARRSRETGCRERTPAGVSNRLNFTTSPIRLSVCRLDPSQSIPTWATIGAWWSVTRTPRELSIDGDSLLVPEGVVETGPWRDLVLEGWLQHDLVGVLAAVSATLAAAHVPIRDLDLRHSLGPGAGASAGDCSVRAGRRRPSAEALTRTATRRVPGRWGRATSGP